MNALTEAALQYLGAGLRVLALAGKKPNPAVHGDHWSWDDSFHGRVETEDEMALLDRSMSKGMGTTGIAILIPQDFLVADVDTERAADLLVELGGMPTEDTIAAQTKNGLHIWYWYPGADRNRWLGDGQEPDPGRTLLFKGFGGYVVAPPSLHFDKAGEQDGQYVWGGNQLVRENRLFMPDILPAKAAERMHRQDLWQEDRDDIKPDFAVTTFEPIPGEPWWKWRPTTTFSTEGLERAIIEAADGNQNNVIHWSSLVALEEGVPYDVAMERLLAAALKGNHPRKRAIDTIRGAYKRAGRK